MSETFVPLVSAISAPRQSSFATLNLKSPIAPARAPETQPASPAPASAACGGKPTVTLQRTGEIVSGIRVQCGCGQVVDLNCIY